MKWLSIRVWRVSENFRKRARARVSFSVCNERRAGYPWLFARLKHSPFRRFSRSLSKEVRARWFISRAPYWAAASGTRPRKFPKLFSSIAVELRHRSFSRRTSLQILHHAFDVWREIQSRIQRRKLIRFSNVSVSSRMSVRFFHNSRTEANNHIRGQYRSNIDASKETPVRARSTRTSDYVLPSTKSATNRSRSIPVSLKAVQREELEIYTSAWILNSSIYWNGAMFENILQIEESSLDLIERKEREKKKKNWTKIDPRESGDVTNQNSRIISLVFRRSSRSKRSLSPWKFVSGTLELSLHRNACLGPGKSRPRGKKLIDEE